MCLHVNVSQCDALDNAIQCKTQLNINVNVVNKQIINKLGFQFLLLF